MEETEHKDPNSEFNGFDSPEIRISTKTQSFGYTSLREILQSPSSSPPETTTVSTTTMTMMSSSPKGSSSWQEIPIRNPLVKHAAMAYLQPMSNQTTSSGSGKGFLASVKENCDCGGDFGCVQWLCDVVSRAAREVFGCGRRSDDREGVDEDGYDDEGVDLKVD